MFNTVRGKKIAILGFAFKKDTNDTRESASIYVCRDLLSEGANIALYDPKVPESTIRADLNFVGVSDDVIDRQLTICSSAEAASDQSHGLAVLTDLDEFATLDFSAIYEKMFKPAFVFDGRNVLPHDKLREIGFTVYAIGKG